jgi:D-3-phosphoglycerate dehydrogenase / 2-oxoglutarate reductase
MARRILVTPRSVTRDGHPALQRLSDSGYELVFSSPGKQPDEEELMHLLPGCVGYLCGVEKVTGRVLREARELQVISRNGTGVDNIDMAAAQALGIRILRAEGTNARGVAELTMALIMGLVRSIPFSDQRIKQGGWERRMGIELAGRTLGLIGCGKVGKLVAKLALAFDLKILAYDPYPDPHFQPSIAFTYSPLGQIWPSADIISLHCPAPEDGRPLIDTDTIAGMKKGVYLVNTARASLLNESAVLGGLESGWISGVAADVFNEETSRDFRFTSHSRMIGTPHIGGFTVESVDRAVSAAVDNLQQELHAVV